MALGLALQARGHAVSIVTSHYHHDRITAAGLGFHPASPDLRPDDKALIRATMDERRGPEEVVRFMLRHLPETYRDYERAVSADGGADLLITSDLAYAGQILAEKTGLRWFSQVLSPIAFFSAYDATVLPPAPWLSKLSALGPALYGAILRAIKTQALKLARPYNDFRRQLGLASIRDPFFTDKNSPELVLAMFSRLLGEPRPDWPPQTVVTGFAFYDPGAEAGTPGRSGAPGDGRSDPLDVVWAGPALAPELRHFLAAGDAPIVFTLGSAAVFDPGEFFIESARAAAELGKRAVLVVGIDPGPLPPASSTIAVCPYAPFSRLFPRAAAIVHQGGSGTTGQGMRAGKPMLVVPYAHDQPDNALRLRRLGVALTIRRAAYRAPAVARALHRVLEDERIASRAASVGAIVSAEDGARVAADAVERIFDQGNRRT